MSDGGKFQALPLSEVRERLLSKRQDAFGVQNRPSIPVPTTVAGPEAPKAPPKREKKPKPVLEPRPCDYAKCGRMFTPRRADQKCCCDDHRKRKWFDAHFMPIPKPEGQS
jgi:hypothetical protein